MSLSLQAGAPPMARRARKNMKRTQSSTCPSSSPHGFHVQETGHEFIALEISPLRRTHNDLNEGTASMFART
jgi:hypothetical protein